MEFNGIDLTAYLKVNDIKGRGIAPNELTTLEVSGMAGSHFVRKRRPSRVLSVKITVKGTSAEEIRTNIDELNAILDVEDDVPIVFPDEPTLIYYGVPGGYAESRDFIRFHQGTIDFFCADPYKYKPETSIAPATEVFSIENGGSADTQPIFEFEALAPVTFAMIQNDLGEYMLLGRPGTVEQEPFERYERVLFSDANTLTGWTTAGTGEIDGSITGTMESANDRFQAADYGTGAGWHGPAIKTSLPEPLTDFRMTAYMALYNEAVPREVGRVEIYMLDVNGNIVCKVAMKDINNDRALTYGEARLGALGNIHHMIDEYGDNPGNWNDFAGHVRIERVGNEWNAYFAMVKPGSGRHHTRRFARFVDYNNEYSDSVAQVVVHCGTYSTRQPISCGVYSLNVYKVNTEPAGTIPYIADTGDIITFDHVTKDLLVNGESRKDLKDFGAQYFSLKKGTNQLAVLPDSSFHTTVRYRERYR